MIFFNRADLIWLPAVGFLPIHAVHMVKCVDNLCD